MARSRGPRVVAELGRPETPQERFQRTQEARRARRSNQTVFNLVVATLASLLVALFFGILLSDPGAGQARSVDFAAVAADAQHDVDEPLAVPELPEGWIANRADLRTGGDGVRVWRVGLITPQDGFVDLKQGIEANPTWVAAQVRGAASRTESHGGLQWTIYDRRDDPDAGNLLYAMTAEAATSTFVLSGTADDDAFAALAQALGEEITS